MPLRGDQIRATSGEIYAHVFENRATGLSRGLYWNVAIECEPIILGGEPWECGVSCDWLTFPIRDWRQLDGASTNDLVTPGMAEASVYIAQHHPMRLSSISFLRSGTSNIFRAEIVGSFNLRGFGDDDTSDCRVSISCDLRFLGVYVVPDNLFPKPLLPEAALGVVERYLDSAQLQLPQWDRFRFVLEPT